MSNPKEMEKRSKEKEKPVVMSAEEFFETDLFGRKGR
jgi:hypothetical protein